MRKMGVHILTYLHLLKPCYDPAEHRLSKSKRITFQGQMEGQHVLRADRKLFSELFHRWTCSLERNKQYIAKTPNTEAALSLTQIKCFNLL